MPIHILIYMLFFLFGTKTTYAQKKYTNIYNDKNILIAQGFIDTGKKTGYWRFYYTNGNIKKQGHFKKGIPVKYWYFYRPDASLEREGHFSFGKPNKWWIFYDKEQKTISKCQLKNGIKNGYCLHYKNDNPYLVTRYKNGKKTNSWKDISRLKKQYKLSSIHYE